MPFICGMRTSESTQPPSSGRSSREGDRRLEDAIRDADVHLQQKGQGIAHGCTIVVDVNDSLIRSMSPSTSFRVNLNVAPPPGVGSTHSRPPWASMMSGARDRQANAHAVPLGGHERGEEIVGDLGCDPRARVGDGHQRLVVQAADADGQFPARTGFHGVDGVADQVDDDLLTWYGRPAPVHRPRALVEADIDAHLAPRSGPGPPLPRPAY